MKKLLLLKKPQSAFTLIELLIVVAIIAVLVSLGAVAYSTAQKNARNAQRQSDLKKISLALEKYYSDHGEYPPSLDCLTVINSSCEPPKNTYMTELPLDPRTNNVYNYTPLNDVDPDPSTTSYQSFELRMPGSPPNYDYEGTIPSEFNPLRSPNP